MADAVTIDADNFCDHLKSLYKAWETVGVCCALPC